MKRRSKLSLSPEDQVDKKRPRGFEDTDAVSAKSEAEAEKGTERAEPEEEAITTKRTRKSTKSYRTRSATNATVAGIDRKKLIKVLAIVAVSAGAIYLL